MTIMPALFVFALTSEHKLSHRMREVAGEAEYAMKAVEWADRQHRNQNKSKTMQQDEAKLRDMYRQSVLTSGIRVIDSPELGAHHQVANYVQQNPFKLIAGIGIPAVAYIYYGRSTKEHLSFQLKLLHTRVFGQFAVICTLLGVMGLKEMMDRQGRFTTEGEVEDRVTEMEMAKKRMMDRLEYQASQQPSYIRKTNLAKPAALT
jgi:hypothetical protein